jgi:hypothetical protein
MNNNIKAVSPYKNRLVVDEFGKIIEIPQGWDFLPAGDPGITRKVTATTVCWRVQIRKGRRFIATGIWAASEVIDAAKREVDSIRATDSYKKNLESSQLRRAKKEEEYSVEFVNEVRRYLSFADCYSKYELMMARAVTTHAIPVGSGTVARTTMIPIEDRAAKAVIAWMRHKTTGYETMKIPLIKGKRREVRRLLAELSVNLLDKYRKGEELDDACPLHEALRTLENKAD